MITLGADWPRDMEVAVGSNSQTAKDSIAIEGKLIHARAPITLKTKAGGVLNTKFDLFLMKAPAKVQAESLFIRSAITVPNEQRYFSVTGIFGALLASDQHVASFLGDAENPAHTNWNTTAEKLKQRWKNGGDRLREIRTSLKRFYSAIGHIEERVDEDALIDFFSIEDLNRGQKNKKQVKPGPPPDLPPSKRWYRIDSRKGGFAIRSTPDTPSEQPFMIHVRIAYDVISGNPLRRYNPLDFQLDKSPIAVAPPKGARINVASLNEMEIEVIDHEFSVEVSGFDKHRDLLVDARREAQ